MHLSVKQVNELHVGTPLAVELEGKEGMRKFMNISSYSKDAEGRDKSAKSRKRNEKLYYGMMIYSVSSDVIENDWDIGGELAYHYEKIDMEEIPELELQIEQYLEDTALLLPSWYCDDVL